MPRKNRKLKLNILKILPKKINLFNLGINKIDFLGYKY